MQAYLLNTGRTIAPFDRPVGQVNVHNRPLGELQADILAALGCRCAPIDSLEQVREFPCLVVADDLYFTPAAMRSFLRAARRRGGNVRAALAKSELTEQFAAALQGDECDNGTGGKGDGADWCEALEGPENGTGPICRDGPSGAAHKSDLSRAPACRAYDCFYLERCDPNRPLEAQAELLPVPHRRVRLRLRVNRYFEPSGRFVLPISPVFLMPLRHWAALLTVNLLGTPGHVLETLRRRPLAAAALPLKVLLRSGSLRPSRWLGKLYLAGRRCQVHPDAHVEASLLGRRVRIGPGAVVRGCVLGDYVEIGPGAVLEGCTLGNHVVVNGNVVVRCSTADEGAGLGAFFMQFSVLGAGAVLCPDSGIFDFRFRGDVYVASGGTSVPSGSRLLGGCLGDRAFLGPGVRLLAGQELPNDCVLVPNPRSAVRTPPHKLPDGVVRLRHRPA